jgi:hypothetical protein
MQGRRLEVIFPKDTDDDLVNDAREHHYEYGGTDLWLAQQPKKSGTDEVVRGTGDATGGLT